MDLVIQSRDDTLPANVLFPRPKHTPREQHALNPLTSPREPDMSRGVSPWRSIKTRVTLFTLAIFLISLWSLALYASRVLREDIEHLLSEQQFSIATILAKDIEGELATRTRDLETVAATISTTLANDPAAVQKRL